MKNFFILSAIALFILSCTGEKGSTAGGKFLTPKVVDKLMAENYIFRSDTVYNIMARASKAQVTKSKQLFMQGLDLYINQKNAAASIKVFRESILYCPDPKTYNYLANAYIDVADSVLADSALNIFYEPEPDMFYTTARLAALKKDTGMAIGNLTEAFGYGFSNKKRLMNDKIFDFIRSQRAFIALVVTYLEDETKLKESLFKTFLASAPELKLPFEMQKDSISYTGIETGSINYDFAAFISGMEDSRFSRDVSNEYYMVGHFDAGNKITAVLYKSVTVIADMPPVEVKLATFDSLGNLLDEKIFAQYSLPTTLFTGSIDANKNVSITELEMKWKNDPAEEGYEGNECTGAELVKETRYRIGPDGKLAAGPGKDEIVNK